MRHLSLLLFALLAARPSGAESAGDPWNRPGMVMIRPAPQDPSRTEALACDRQLSVGVMSAWPQGILEAHFFTEWLAQAVDVSKFDEVFVLTRHVNGLRKKIAKRHAEFPVRVEEPVEGEKLMVPSTWMTRVAGLMTSKYAMFLAPNEMLWRPSHYGSGSLSGVLCRMVMGAPFQGQNPDAVVQPVEQSIRREARTQPACLGLNVVSVYFHRPLALLMINTLRQGDLSGATLIADPGQPAFLSRLSQTSAVKNPNGADKLWCEDAALQRRLHPLDYTNDAYESTQYPMVLRFEGRNYVHALVKDALEAKSGSEEQRQAVRDFVFGRVVDEAGDNKRPKPPIPLDRYPRHMIEYVANKFEAAWYSIANHKLPGALSLQGFSGGAKGGAVLTTLYDALKDIDALPDCLPRTPQEGGLSNGPGPVENVVDSCIGLSDKLGGGLLRAYVQELRHAEKERSTAEAVAALVDVTRRMDAVGAVTAVDEPTVEREGNVEEFYEDDGQADEAFDR